MYCPKCRSEYREGFFKCADCGVPLVASLPPDEQETILEYFDLEEVMTSFNIGEITLARSVLDDYQISYLVQVDYFSTCYGSIRSTILVPKDKVNKAKDLLRDFL